MPTEYEYRKYRTTGNIVKMAPDRPRPNLFGSPHKMAWDQSGTELGVIPEQVRRATVPATAEEYETRRRAVLDRMARVLSGVE